jgi:hypothetical protein
MSGVVSSLRQRTSASRISDLNRIPRDSLGPEIEIKRADPPGIRFRAVPRIGEHRRRAWPILVAMVIQRIQLGLHATSRGFNYRTSMPDVFGTVKWTFITRHHRTSQPRAAPLDCVICRLRHAQCIAGSLP